MPVKRRLSKMHDGRITPTVLGLYQRALELRERAHRSDDDRHAAHAAERDVDRALRVRLWETSIFDTIDYQHPDDPDWARAAELRQRLDAALAARRPRRPESAA